MTVALTTLAWIAVTFATKPEPIDTLVAFYERVRPAGPGWAPVAAAAALPASRESVIRSLAAWLLGCALIYALLFGIGLLILGPRLAGAGLVASALLSGALIFKVFEPDAKSVSDF
jgi:solute:Na+ symporter, SSS family